MPRQPRVTYRSLDQIADLNRDTPTGESVNARDLVKAIANGPTWKSPTFGSLLAGMSAATLENYLRAGDPLLSYTQTYIDNTDPANPITHSQVTNLDPVAVGVLAFAALLVLLWALHLHKKAQNAEQTLKDTFGMNGQNINDLVGLQKEHDDKESCCPSFIGC